MLLLVLNFSQFPSIIKAHSEVVKRGNKRKRWPLLLQISLFDTKLYCVATSRPLKPASEALYSKSRDIRKTAATLSF